MQVAQSAVAAAMSSRPHFLHLRSTGIDQWYWLSAEIPMRLVGPLHLPGHVAMDQAVLVQRVVRSTADRASRAAGTRE